MNLNVRELFDYQIATQDGVPAGQVDDVLFDDQAWCVRYFVVDTGGWLTGRKVLVSPIAVTGVETAERRIATDLTREQIESSPGIETAPPLSRQAQVDYHNHFNWPSFWGGYTMGNAALFGLAGQAMLAGNERLEPSGPPPDDYQESRDVSLRSAKSVLGFDVIDSGRERFAELDDLLVEPDGWEVAATVLDIEQADRHVLLPVKQIESVGDVDGPLRLRVSAATARQAPAIERPQDEGLLDRVKDYFGIGG